MDSRVTDLLSFTKKGLSVQPGDVNELDTAMLMLFQHGQHTSNCFCRGYSK